MSAANGAPSPELTTLYQRLAEGGVGLISTSACLPDRGWVADLSLLLSLDAGTDLAAWEDAVRTVHRAGARISVQLAPFFVLDGRQVAPWAHQPGLHALEPGEIERLVLSYGAAAARARRVGADAVQIHAGHGYPLAQFLSPYFNRREDRYGGSPAGRARILVEIRRAVAEAAGRDFPVWVKMNTLDGVPGGMTPDDAAPYGQILADAGYGAIEVTGGSPGGSHDSRGPIRKNDWTEGFYLPNAALIKANTPLPVAAVGGIRRLEMAEDVLARGTADLISLSRPLIREPDLIRRWESGDTSPARCRSCNGCLEWVYKGKGLCCVWEQPGATEEH
jgi:2,4-dienoyl-CoA reductase-like NADH-dependent reductase (Old Yellow Enzyme family)